MKQKTIAIYKDENVVYSRCLFTTPDIDMFFPHTHSTAELLLFIRGKASYVINGNTVRLRPNDLVFVNPNVSHYLKITGAADYERYCILFDMSLLPTSLAERLTYEGKLVSTSDDPILRGIFTKLEEYCVRFGDEENGILFKQAIIEIMYNVANKLEGSSDKASNSSPEVRKAVEYIKNNLIGQISIDTLCEELYVSKSYLHKQFKKYMSTTPKRYIAELRLSLARQKIRLGQKPSAVYSVCGFVDYNTFYRAYKKQFGHAPRDDFDTAENMANSEHSY